MQNIINNFIRLCIFLGDGVIFLLKQILFLGLFLFFLIRKLLLILFYPLLWLGQKGASLFTRKKKTSTTKSWFSLNNYLFFYRIKYFALGFVVALLIFGMFQAIEFINNLPNLSLLNNTQTALSTHIYDRNGKMLYEIYGDQNRTPVKLSSLPSYVEKATIAIEDKDFYRHNGVSLFGGILRAVKDTLANKKLQGGSTITQQLVKNALLTPERTIERKVKEIVLALLAERKYTKKQILEMYLNQVPYGGTAWGIEEAAKMYFGVNAKDLNIAQAALLAGLPQEPSVYSPYTNSKGALARQKEVLKAMYEQKYLTAKEYKAAKAYKLSFKKPTVKILAPHFVFYVKNELEAQFGARTVITSGLKVYTTLDYEIQKEAEKILSEELAKVSSLNVGNGAILVTRPSTGEILAMVGSVDFFDTASGAYNITTALRQPGSSIKPLNYLLGLKKGLTAASLLDDSPTKFGGQNGGQVYAPVNYDGAYHGSVPLRYALANSYNIPAVKVLDYNGVDNFINFAKQLGISTWEENRQNFGLSLTLGGGEVTMIDMATAYGVIRNLGTRAEVYAVNEVDDAAGQMLFQKKTSEKRILGMEEPFIISDIMSDNVARSQAFGSNSPLNFGEGYISVKTGTTDLKRDNWTIGFTRPTMENQYSDILVVVWVGNNDNSPMNPALASGITGAAPIWRRVMEKLVNPGLFKETKILPEKIVSKSCYFGRTEYFVSGTEDKANCYYSPTKPTTTP